jgi:hypothetical protein
MYEKKLNRNKVKKALTIGGFCGSYTELAKRCGVARNAITVFLEKSENQDLMELFKDKMEQLIDLAEEKIAHRIDKDDYNAICFFLRTKAKHRGWGEQPLVTMPNSLRIELVPIGFEPPKQIEDKDVVDVKEIEDKDSEKQKD